MSEHFVKKGEPPPGISSFTKIRLGWISPEQAVVVKPGESAMTFLSPLSRKGEKEVIKVVLSNGDYYLVENRQPVGFDKNLPDSGILVYKVFPKAQEGYGTVELMDANPGAPHFSQAAYRLQEGRGNMFVDKKTDVAIIPLWRAGENVGVMVTTSQKGTEALNAALLIGKLLARYPEPRGKPENDLIGECIAAFRNLDFQKTARLAQDRPGNGK
jgi:hypothetical protein